MHAIVPRETCPLPAPDFPETPSVGTSSDATYNLSKVLAPGSKALCRFKSGRTHHVVLGNKQWLSNDLKLTRPF